ncbi:hypothetical protein EYF80_012595 [Liparis tanakae]|uniref:Uncharacterized protein n=1 Tax=Liparis tanakae TaxID=230148 RepID=A0A4Z2IGI9_9TELE|nr:hypothetical protein EYF80_012595 [Liparis tanakae]
MDLDKHSRVAASSGELLYTVDQREERKCAWLSTTQLKGAKEGTVDGITAELVGYHDSVRDVIVFDPAIGDAVGGLGCVEAVRQVGAAGALRAGGPAQSEVLPSHLYRERRQKVVSPCHPLRGNTPLEMTHVSFEMFHSVGAPFTCSFIWSSSGSQYRQNGVSPP